MDALFAAIGAVFASGPGVLLLAAVVTVIVVVWDWRIALAGIIVLHLGVSAVLVHVHSAPAFLIVGQLLAICLCAAMLGIAVFAQPLSPLAARPGYWPLRLLALVFIVGAWWFIDPGITLPLFSQPETDIVLWVAVCGLLILCLSDNPLFTGIALLIWGIPVYAVATILLPGSGLSALVGVAEILVTLACSYLVLVEPLPAQGFGRPRLIRSLPPSRWALLRPRRYPDFAGEAVSGGELAAPIAIQPTSLPAGEADAVMEQTA